MPIADSEGPLDLPDSPRYTHRAHRFPGKFHPPLVSKILSDNPGHDCIVDPMCGSGTVGVESIARGKSVYCVDLDPLSCLITRAKSNPVNADDLRNVATRILTGVDEFPEKGMISQEEAKKSVRENLRGTRSVPPLNLFHWFDPYVAVGYSRLLKESYKVLEIESNKMRDAIRTILASIIRRISRADPQPVSGLEVTSVRREQLQNGLEFNIESSYKKSVDELAKGYEELNKIDNIGKCEVFERDARYLSKYIANRSCKPSLAITSPPYCNAIEYTRRHRLEFEWLGLFEGDTLSEQGEKRLERSRELIGSQNLLKEEWSSLPDVPHEEIESVLRIIEEDAEEPKKANILRKYFLDAFDWIEEIHMILPPDGLFAMTIGPSTSYGEKIQTPQFMRDIAEEIGFEVESIKRYKLTNNKMQYPTNGPTTDTESLIMLKKN